jgi:membrane protein implicated in regulation of membrane protease activity
MMEAIFWIVLTIVFAVIEIITVGLTSIWFAGGALAALLCYALGMNPVWQFIVFVAVSVVLLCFTRPWALKYLKPHLTRTNYEEALEKNVCLTERVDNIQGTGTAVLNGQEWTARAYEEGKVFEAGMIVKVKEIRGVTMYVVESDAMPQAPEALERSENRI